MSKFNNEFLYNAYNIRIDSVSDESLMAISNEKGNVKADLIFHDGIYPAIEGVCIGYCVIEELIVLFTNSKDWDYIYVISKSNIENTFNVRRLYYGKLGFDRDHLIETLGVYENNQTIKVYFVDGINPIRVCNVARDENDLHWIVDYQTSEHRFKLWPDLSLTEIATITLIPSGGQFHSGTIQYAFTYWNKNGIETNIVYVSDIYYISNSTRVGSPEEICLCSFNIKLEGIDSANNKFDFLRVYAIQRTSLNGAPVVRVVYDIKINDSMTMIDVTDNGMVGFIYPLDAFLLVGGEELVVGTISHKDNVLFGGNIKVSRKILDISLSPNDKITPINKTISLLNNGSLYNFTYDPTLQPVRHWKNREVYMTGVQFQYKTGVWSNVIPIGELAISADSNGAYHPYSVSLDGNYTKIEYICLDIQVNDLLQKALDEGYLRVRAVYVPLEYNMRNVVCQGIITGTLANVNNRTNNGYFGMPDYRLRSNDEAWFERDTSSVNSYSTLLNYSRSSRVVRNYHFDYVNVYPYLTDISSEPENARTMGVWIGLSVDSELLTSYIYTLSNPVNSFNDMNQENALYLKNTDIPNRKNGYHVDRNLVNFLSPDVEYNGDQINFSGINDIIITNVAWLSSQHNSLTGINKDDSTWDTEAFINDPIFHGLQMDLLTSLGFRSYGDGYFYAANLWSMGDTVPYLRLDGTPIGSIINGFTKKYSRFSGFNTSQPVSVLNVNSNYFQYGIHPISYIHVDDIANNIHCNSFIRGGFAPYNSRVNEVIRDDKSRTCTINFNSNTHLAFFLKEPVGSSPWTPNTGNNYLWSLPIIQKLLATNIKSYTDNSLYYSNNTYFNTQIIKDSAPMTSSIKSYVWVCDLYRKLEGKYNNINPETLRWIPCSDSYRIDWLLGQNNPQAGYTFIADRGDTFIQRYDCIKTFATAVEQSQQMTEGFSIWIESFVNLHGRYDHKRAQTILHDYSNDSYKINMAYSQMPNFWEYFVINPYLLSVNDLPMVFIWSEPKKYGEFIDSYTKLNLLTNQTVDGELGSINKLVNYKNELFGFQDKGIFNILFNQRSMLNDNLGQSISLGTTGKVQGVRYITRKSGTMNKWSVIQSPDSLFFIDDNTYDLFLFGDPPKSLTTELGFKNWATNNFGNRKPYSLDNSNQFILNIDLSNNSMYINSDKYSLCFNDRLKQFESFFSHEEVPFMFNSFGKFLSVKNVEEEVFVEHGINETVDLSRTELWINNTGHYGEYYAGHTYKDGRLRGYMPSEIEYWMNPDTLMDKVFDNIQYRMDVFQVSGFKFQVSGSEVEEDKYLPNDTFDKFEIENEYQYGKIDFDLRNRKLGINKKFRIWNFPIPRDERGDRPNRIRNTWVKSKFTFNNQYNRRFKLSDVVLSYTI